MSAIGGKLTLTRPGNVPLFSMAITRKWLHRIGYVTTVVVALQLIVIGCFAAREWPEARRRHRYALELTRTHSGGLRPDTVRFRPDELDLLGTLPGSGPANEFRFVAMPSLRGSSFAYSLAQRSATEPASGILNIFPRKLETDRFEETQTVRFTLPAASARIFLDRVASLTTDWKGEDSGCLDGTGVAFELKINGNVTSGRGNAACSEHYGELSLQALKPVARLIPTELRPAGKSWRAGSTE